MSEESCSPRLLKYKCHKVVEAGLIAGMHENKLGVVNEHNIPIDVPVTDEWLSKHSPEPGGYYVRYEDGYESYSPRESFEAGYATMDLTNPFVFASAMNLFVTGYRCKRLGWNGPGQYVSMWTPSDTDDITEPYLVLMNAQGGLVPWVPSQGDLFGDDWMIY